jgi:hypothetical protein
VGASPVVAGSPACRDRVLGYTCQVIDSSGDTVTDVTHNRYDPRNDDHNLTDHWSGAVNGKRMQLQRLRTGDRLGFDSQRD